MAGALPDFSEVPSLASHVTKRSHRQELRHPLSVDRQDIRDLLLPRGQVAGYLRPGQRENPGHVLGPDLLPVHPQAGGLTPARSSARSADTPWGFPYPWSSPAPDPTPSSL